MANTIRIKKRASGGASGAPSSLAPSELAFSEVDSILFYGFGDAGNGESSGVIAIGGNGAFVTRTGTQSISGTKTITGTLNLGGATLSGNTTFSNNLTVSGDLSVSGTTTTINTETVDVKDKNITLGDVTTPSDTTADGGGISLLGATTKTFNWINSTDSWTSSENIDLASGKDYAINGTTVLNASSLGSGVTGSSLTSVGTITTGVWNGTPIAHGGGGTGNTTYNNGELLIGNSSGGLTAATLTAGSNVTITEASGSITIASTTSPPTAGDGIDVTGSTISADLKADGGLLIESGEIALDLAASSITGTLAIADGGTGATSASAARTALGAQASDAQLTTLAGMSAGTATNLAALTGTEVAILDGATVSTAELNKLDGCTASTAELNKVDGLTATAAELNKLDGCLATTAELNNIDGNTSATATTLAAADRMVVNDAGTMVQVALSDLVTFLENGTVSGFELNGGTF